MLPLLAAVLLAGTPAPPADTTVAVRRGDRLVIENLSGEIAVVAWDRSEVQLRGEAGDRSDVGVSRSGGRVSLVRPRRRGADREVEVVLRIPAWMEVDIGGRDLDVDVSGLAANVVVRNVEGDIRLRDIRGDARLSTVDGEVTVIGAQGRIVARSQGDDLTLRNIRGEIDVESGSGDIALQDVELGSLRAETLDGDVSFDGPLERGGTYRIAVHSGDARVAVDPDVPADVEISTFDGEFTTEFPVVVDRYRGGRSFQFTIGGGGGARLEVRVFDGEIHFARRR